MQGIPEVQFQRIAVMGELTKMGCTMLGAWGPASATGGLLQVTCQPSPHPCLEPPATTSLWLGGLFAQTLCAGVTQLRALDWDTDGPFQAYPLVLVRHPSNPEEGHAHAVVSRPPSFALDRLGLWNQENKNGTGRVPR
eukprot:COSAG04_NODE_130_length_24323_cov_50.932835_39_plen_138_part_00